MSVMITGAAGMVGSYLAEWYAGREKTVGIYRFPTVDPADLPAAIDLIECDVRCGEALFGHIEQHRPNKIYHLAAQSYPVVSLERPEETFAINAIGTINVFEAIKRVRAADKAYDPVVVVACSSAEYGASLTPENLPIREEAPLLPLHPYGVSKVAQDLLAYQYFVNAGIRAVRARIFNCTGPRKTGDVCADFTRRVVEIERGVRDFLPVGNLWTRRAITDVRDLAEALVLLAEHGVAGEAYNISGEWVYAVAEILDLLRSQTTGPFQVRPDPSLTRRVDEPAIYGDSAKLRAATGWRQRVGLEETLRDMLEYWRGREEASRSAL